MLHNPIDFRQANDLSGRNIGHVGFANDGHKVVLAVRVKQNVLLDEHLVVLVFVFEEFDRDLQAVRNFRTSVREFLYWSQQGWDVGTIIVLNPTSSRLALQTNGSVVDEIGNTSMSGRLLDQNFLPIKNTNFNLVRAENFANGNRFGITTLNGTGI